jgi:hypothetical protein
MNITVSAANTERVGSLSELFSSGNGLVPSLSQSGLFLNFGVTDVTHACPCFTYQLGISFDFATDTFTAGYGGLTEFIPPDVLFLGANFSGSGTFSVTPTPLPAALPLFATGLGALGLFGWRRKRTASGTLAVIR